MWRKWFNIKIKDKFLIWKVGGGGIRWNSNWRLECGCRKMRSPKLCYSNYLKLIKPKKSIYKIEKCAHVHTCVEICWKFWIAICTRADMCVWVRVPLEWRGSEGMWKFHIVKTLTLVTTVQVRFCLVVFYGTVKTITTILHRIYNSICFNFFFFLIYFILI